MLIACKAEVKEINRNETWKGLLVLVAGFCWVVHGRTQLLLVYGPKRNTEQKHEKSETFVNIDGYCVMYNFGVGYT